MDGSEVPTLMAFVPEGLDSGVYPYLNIVSYRILSYLCYFLPTCRYLLIRKGKDGK